MTSERGVEIRRYLLPRDMFRHMWDGAVLHQVSRLVTSTSTQSRCSLSVVLTWADWYMFPRAPKMPSQQAPVEKGGTDGSTRGDMSARAAQRLAEELVKKAARETAPSTPIVTKRAPMSERAQIQMIRVRRC